MHDLSIFSIGKRGLRAKSLLAQTKGLLRAFDLKAKKGLGQHFLVDEGVLRSIIRAADLAATDTVIEVGPGLGILTRELAVRAERVIAIEIDSRLASALAQTLADVPHLTIVNADVLQIDPVALIISETVLGPAPCYKVIANLPYYITSPTLRHFLEASVKPRYLVVMVQKEVAQAIVATGAKMSLLSASIQFYGRPAIVDYVPARSFYPPPEVDSAILRIEVYQRPKVEVADTGEFFKIVRAGFCARRKQLRNSLAQGLSLPPAAATELLRRAGVNPQRRAETLSLEEWGEIYQAFTANADSLCLC